MTDGVDLGPGVDLSPGVAPAGPVLRAWTGTDAADLRAAYRSSPDLALELGEPDLSDPERSRQYVLEQLVPVTPARRSFAVEDGGRVVGNVGVSAIEHRHGTAWVSYWLAEPARGRGLATRALVAATGWAFEQAGVFRLELGHRVNNVASCRVATAAGFAPEGMERAKLRYGDLRFDVETHARLVTDPPPSVTPLPLTT